MQRLERLLPDSLTLEQRRLYETIIGGPRGAGPQHFSLKDEQGGLRGPFNALLLSPNIGGAVQELGSKLRFDGSLGSRAREISILLVAARCDSEFEKEAHEAIARSVGLSSEELEMIGREEVPDFTDIYEYATAQMTISLLDGDVDDAAWNKWIAILGRETLFELTVIVGYYSMLALQLRVFRA